MVGVGADLQLRIQDCFR